MNARFLLTVLTEAVGGQEEIDQLVLNNVKLAYYLAHRYGRSYDLEPQEAEQEAIAGLVKAANQYDPEIGQNFSSYASRTIINSLRHIHRYQQGKIKYNRVDLDSERPNPSNHGGDESDYHDIIGHEDPGFSRIGGEENMQQIQAELSSIQEPTQEWMRQWLDGKTYREIAVDAGVSFVYVGRKIQQALSTIKDKLKKSELTPS